MNKKNRQKSIDKFSFVKIGILSMINTLKSSLKSKYSSLDRKEEHNASNLNQQAFSAIATMLIRLLLRVIKSADKLTPIGLKILIKEQILQVELIIG